MSYQQFTPPKVIRALAELTKEYDQPLDVPAGEPVLNEFPKRDTQKYRGKAELLVDDKEFPELLDMPPIYRKAYLGADDVTRARLRKEWRASHPEAVPLPNVISKVYVGADEALKKEFLEDGTEFAVQKKGNDDGSAS